MLMFKGLKTNMAIEERRSKTAAASRPTPVVKPRSRSRRRRRQLPITLLVIVLAAAAGFFAYKYHQANQKAEMLANPKQAAAQQVDDLVAKVGKLVVLPTGEKPTVATVTDISKLQGQAFFQPAQNGDKVLIYTQAKKAILYRPSQNKVIEIAPLNIGSSDASNSGSGSATTPTTDSSASSSSSTSNSSKSSSSQSPSQ